MGDLKGDSANVNDLLHEHKVFDLKFLDQIYLNVYGSELQMSG